MFVTLDYRKRFLAWFFLSAVIYSLTETETEKKR